VLEGRRVLLVEDTIVRSTTMKALIDEMRRRGRAREIHVRVACPPIVAPCFYGIDMSTVDELFASHYLNQAAPEITDEVQERMARELGADSLRYLPVEAVSRAIGLDMSRLCRACITGRYPTTAGQRLYQIAITPTAPHDPPNTPRRRTYERQPTVVS
jgi:amidophosphoribosyltransferase